jgi:hypothetical protein
MEDKTRIAMITMAIIGEQIPWRILPTTLARPRHIEGKEQYLWVPLSDLTTSSGAISASVTRTKYMPGATITVQMDASLILP